MVSSIDTESADVDYEDTSVLQNRAARPHNDETPACLSCRKKKSKCSREQPCTQCVKSSVECTYDDRRQKGGYRTGVIEQLCQRMDSLESMFLGQGIWLQQFLRGTGGERVAQPGRVADLSDLHSHANRLKQTFCSLAANGELEAREHGVSFLQNSPTKRKCEEESLHPLKRVHAAATSEDLGTISTLPKEIDDTMIRYFETIHPWLPVLHPLTFIKRARSPERPAKVDMILDAIVAITAKYLQKDHTKDAPNAGNYAEACKRKAMSAAVESNSIESIQALLLLAFDTLSTGRGCSPWFLIPLVTSKVDSLQLSFEDAAPRESYEEFYLSTVSSLQPASTWAEAEEIRRVFWAAFVMDRFWSIASGTNPAISSKHVRRRLPCDGYWWVLEKCVETAYFKPDSQEYEMATDKTFPFTSPDATTEEPNSSGGLAYLIEATESLSLVTKFHTQHPLDLENANQWLNRFRQLDSRLLQWEMGLRQRWRDVKVVNGYIDENLTLAHMTHNAAIIVLHRELAHPTPGCHAWLSGSISSASREACFLAAKKIDKLSRRFLGVRQGIAPHQFAFCLFVAGQVLLAQASFHEARPPADFDSIIASLNEVSRRLCPESDTYIPSTKFAMALTEKRDRHFSSCPTEATAAKAHQPTPPLANVPSVTDIPSVLRQDMSSPPESINPGGLDLFSHDGMNRSSENVTESVQSLLPGSRLGSSRPLSISSAGQTTSDDDANNVIGGSGGASF
ncbi:Transcription factor, fungi [Metarhizium guizhouense ARSEF 977]|uniref:Transcription factor, fungi n=1 Tax=Metarhizium guizhouense (strain ARSEF 977) TaxID=1276136 RepID=A0A0B4GVB1_METGA|nr:Transcription factor, fungi [Metarhizium guizhouense ARSEF 977]